MPGRRGNPGFGTVDPRRFRGEIPRRFQSIRRTTTDVLPAAQEAVVNRVYRTVFNRSTRTVQVASELTRTRRKGGRAARAVAIGAVAILALGLAAVVPAGADEIIGTQHLTGSTGLPGQSGGPGYVASPSATLNIDAGASVQGGDGGPASSASGGDGGTGVAAGDDTGITNYGSISGGSGGSGQDIHPGGAGGAGGAGIAGSNQTLDNHGSISGGSGGSDSAGTPGSAFGTPGTALSFTGTNLITNEASGIISGGGGDVPYAGPAITVSGGPTNLFNLGTINGNVNLDPGSHNHVTLFDDSHLDGQLAIGNDGGKNDNLLTINTASGTTRISTIGNFISNSTSLGVPLASDDGFTFGGTLEAAGAGTLEIDGLPSAGVAVTGLEVDSGSTMQIGGGPSSTVLDMNALRTVSIDGGGTLGFVGQTPGAPMDAVISGSGTFNVGAGNLVLSGDSSGFTGITNIQGTGDTLPETAELVIASGASLGGTVNVNSRASLFGLGTVGSPETTLTNNSLVFPGGITWGVPGTLTVGGDYLQTLSGNLNIVVTPTEASRLAVDGKATLAGYLEVQYAPGTYHSTSYQIVTASHGVIGTFSSGVSANHITGPGTTASGTPAGVTQSVVYNPKDVTLNIVGQSQGGGGSSGSPAPFVIGPSPDQTSILTATPSDLLIGAQVSSNFLLNAGGLGVTPSANGWTSMPGHGDPWIHISGSMLHAHGNSGAVGSRDQAWNFMAGTDRYFGKWDLGVAAGYQHDRVVSGIGRSDVDTARVAGYGHVQAGPAYLSGTLGYGYSFIDGRGDFGAIGYTDSSNHAQSFTAGLQAQTPFHAGRLTVAPRVGLRYAHVAAPGFDQYGANLADAFALSVGGQSMNSFQPYFGLGGRYTVASGAHGKLDLAAHVDYAVETLGTNRFVQVTAPDGTAFSVAGTANSRSQVTAGASLHWRLDQANAFVVGYDALLPTGNLSGQAVQVTFNHSF